MKAAGVAALVLCLAASVLGEDGAKNRPVSKVVTLLKDMVTQLQKEADEDEEVYEAMGCWCETNDKQKTKAISDAESRIASLTASIEELTGTSARLNAEIGSLSTEIAKNSNALDQATALREKQETEFETEEKDMLQSIASLKSAVKTLGKHNAATLIQKSTQAEEDLLDVVAGLKAALRRHGDLLSEVVTPRQRRAVDAFLQAPDTYLLEQAGPGSYAPQSGEVFGVISQMKETFETNLAQSQKDEAENSKAYTDLKAAKTEEITAAQGSVETKTVELADTDEKLAQSKEDKVDTQEGLNADTKFLAALKERCANADKEYEARQKTRQEETTAVSKALEFLSSDDARELFGKTFNPSLLQQRSESRRREALARLLQRNAAKFHSPPLAALAVRARLDAFGKVKETLQGMIDKLLKEKDDDIKHKDFCIESFNQNEKETQQKEREKADTVTLIDDLQMTMDTLAKSIETLKAEIAEMEVQMKRAGEEREKANKDFQETIADQRATQKLLTAALDVLKGFYAKGSALMQSTRKMAGRGGRQTMGQGQAPPPGFASYEKQGSSGGVMGMIEMIIDDAKAMEAEAIQAETEGQIAYEELVRDTNAAIDEKAKDIVAKSDVKGKTEQQKVEEEVHRDNVLADLDSLTQESMDLHRSCDFLLRNFDARANARDEEAEALKQGIAMFSGASFSAFLERH